MSRSQRRLALVVLASLLAAGIAAPQATAREPEQEESAASSFAPERPCLDHAVERAGLGLSCRVDIGFKVFLRDGSAIYTHGGDPLTPELIEVAHHAAKAPFCVTSATEYRNIAIYTRPSDKADRYAEMAPKIRTMVHQANGHVHGEALNTGGPADLRFACASGVVTVLSAALATGSASDTFSSIISDLKALGHNDPKAKYWIWHDDLITCGCSGIGQLWGDSSRSVNNYNNGGSGQPMYAATFYESWTTMLHENGHNMGAVQNDAPDSNTLGHCNDGLDIMCYGEGGQPYDPNVCTGYSRFDCHYDTYFNLNPASGSYLDTHWNIGWAANRFLQFGNVKPVMTELSCAPATVEIGASTTCSFRATDSSVGLAYTLDWGDGTPTVRAPASGYLAAGTLATATRSWGAPATFTVTVTATDDATPALTSDPLTTTVRIAHFPVFTSAACAPGAIVESLAGRPLSVPVAATTSAAGKTIALSLVSGPAGATLGATPGNPATGTLAWPTTVAGTHLATVRATDNEGLSRDCTMQLVVRPIGGESLALAAWAGSAVPASGDVASPGARQRGPGATMARQSTVGQPATVFVDAVEEGASVGVAGSVATSRGHTQLGEARLAGGLVVVEGLAQNATLTFDATTSAYSVTTTPVIGRITVSGVPIALPVGPARTEIPLSDGSTLVLYERSVEATGTSAVYREDLVRFYGREAYGRAEAILGSVVLRAGSQADAAPTQARFVNDDDDAGSGRDAGAGANAVPVGPGVYDGRFVGNDTMEVYALTLAHGENVKFVVQSAPQAHAQGAGALPTLDTLSHVHLRLYDPTGALREQDLPIQGSPVRVELNADITGRWLAEIVRPDSGGRGLNYTFAVTVAPVPLRAQNDALTPNDARDTCGPGAPVVTSGEWVGVLRDSDRADVYTFQASIGQHIALAMKPGEDHDGFDAALELYDRNCTLIGLSDWTTSPLKGVPEAIAHIPATYTGAYHARIVRVNGVGNHYLTLAVVDPHPTATQNDALTGGDAPTTGIEAPPAFFQGRLHEGDTGDAYKLRFNLRQSATVVVAASALSSYDIALRTPNGIVVQPTTFVDGYAVWSLSSTLVGPYMLSIAARYGGGGYSVAYGP